MVLPALALNQEKGVDDEKRVRRKRLARKLLVETLVVKNPMRERMVVAKTRKGVKVEAKVTERRRMELKPKQKLKQMILGTRNWMTV